MKKILNTVKLLLVESFLELFGPTEALLEDDILATALEAPCWPTVFTITIITHITKSDLPPQLHIS